MERSATCGQPLKQRKALLRCPLRPRRHQGKGSGPPARERKEEGAKEGSSEQLHAAGDSASAQEAHGYKMWLVFVFEGHLAKSAVSGRSRRQLGTSFSLTLSRCFRLSPTVPRSHIWRAPGLGKAA